MDAFVQPLYELADFDAIIRQLKKPGIVQVSGCLDSQKAHFTNGLLREFPFRLIVAENDLKAKAFYEDFRLYDPEVLYYPARDLIFYQADIHGNLLTRQRIQVLRTLKISFRRQPLLQLQEHHVRDCKTIWSVVHRSKASLPSLQQLLLYLPDYCFFL